MSGAALRETDPLLIVAVVALFFLWIALIWLGHTIRDRRLAQDCLASVGLDCLCMLRLGHQFPHRCECGGQWTALNGEFRQVRWPDEKMHEVPW